MMHTQHFTKNLILPKKLIIIVTMSPLICLVGSLYSWNIWSRKGKHVSFLPKKRSIDLSEKKRKDAKKINSGTIYNCNLNINLLPLLLIKKRQFWAKHCPTSQWSSTEFESKTLVQACFSKRKCIILLIKDGHWKSINPTTFIQFFSVSCSSMHTGSNFRLAATTN